MKPRGSPGLATGLFRTSGPGSFFGRPTVRGDFKIESSNVFPMLPILAIFILLLEVSGGCENRPIRRLAPLFPLMFLFVSTHDVLLRTALRPGLGGEARRPAQAPDFQNQYRLPARFLILSRMARRKAFGCL